MDGYSYAIELVEKISGPAKTARQQIDSLTSSLSRDADELQKLEQGMRDLQALGLASAEVTKEWTAAIEEKKAAIEDASGEIRDLVKQEREAAEAADEAARAERKAADEAQDMGAAFEMAAPYIAAVAAALAVVAGLALGGMKLSLEASLFKNQTTAALQSVVGTSEAARETFQFIRKVSDEIGVSEAKAQRLGLSLLDAGVAQADLGDAIKSIALLEKVRGEEAANKLADLVKKSAAAGSFKFDEGALEGTGLATADVVGALAANLGKSTGEIEQAMKDGKIAAADGIAAINDALGQKLGKPGGLQSFEDAAGKLWEKVTRLFEDVDAGPLFEVMRELGELFDEGNAAGDAMRFLMTTVFSGMFSAAKEAFPYVKAAVLELVIVALKLYIAAKPLVAQFRELWASASEGDTLITVVRTVVNVIAAVAVVVGVVVGAVVGLQVAIVAFGYYAISIFMGIAESITGALGGAWAFVQNLFSVEGATQIATALIDGLVGGITGGAARVIEALKGVGTGAIQGVKDVLGIASPSKVGQDLADNFVGSFADTAEDGATQAQAAMATAVEPPSSTGGGGGGAGMTITLGEGAIVIQINAGGASAQEIANEIVPSALAAAFEEFLLSMGGGAPAGGTTG